MKLPIGYSDFQDIITNKFDFVDKSLFIKDILDDAQVILITRPRRFGKTLNMSMLKYFFTLNMHGRIEGLFDALKIAQESWLCNEHQGKYPVIFLTFKDVKQANFESVYEKISELIIEAFNEHAYLQKSGRLSPNQQVLFDLILQRKASSIQIENSLRTLTQCLFEYYQVKPIILIDEYDTPIQSGYMHNYYDKIVSFFRNFFSAAMKDNPYLFKAVLTGILRVSRESMFSGLNNLKVYSVLHPKYSAYFGFTEKEVIHLLNQAEFKDKITATLDAIKDWYNGYQIGNDTLYNPWSIVNCIQDGGVLKPYWVNTSDNALIKTLLLKSSVAFKERFELLLQGNSIEYLIDENFSFPDLNGNHEAPVWSLLLMAGYLKVSSYRDTNRGPLCQLAIPNQEIRNLYQVIIEQWLANGYGLAWYDQFIAHLLNGNMVEFTQGLTRILEQTVSVHDVAKEPEAFYHGLMIGLTASLHGHPNYDIKSNRESGYGRYDYIIISRNPEKLTVILEFKKVDLPENKKSSAKSIAILDKAAKEALQQIDNQAYLAELKQQGKKNILKIGIAFCGKRFSVMHEKN